MRPASPPSLASFTLGWRQGCGCAVFAALLLLLPQEKLTASDPTAEQQYWLELTNHFRSDPQGELAKLVNFSAPGVWDVPQSNDAYIANALNYFGTSAADLAAQFSSLGASPPVAWSSALNQSATSYSDLMVTTDQQSHTLDGLSLSQRVVNGGYSNNWLEVGENLFASTQTLTHGHGAFVIDWGDGNGSDPGFGNGIQNPAGHREVLLDGAFKEIGIGFQSIAIPGGNVAAVGPYVVTQHFGTQFRYDGVNYIADAILTGSVYADIIAADLFYTPGEGLAGTAINVYDDLSGILVASGFSNSAGGFNIALAGLTDGVVYRVEAPGSYLPAQTFTLNAHTEDYGAPVIFYDNVYSSFMMVPEPGSHLLCFAAALHGLLRRSRRYSC